METITKKEAQKRGYKVIAHRISAHPDDYIHRNIERDMEGIDAVWIIASKTTLSLGRKASEVKLSVY